MSVSRTVPFGETRTHVAFDHALVAADSHVRSPLDGWPGSECVVLISPAMGAGPRGPRFCQYLVHAKPGAQSRPAAAGVQRLVFVLGGALTVGGKPVSADGFAWLPPDCDTVCRCEEEATLLVIEKPYAALDDVEAPETIVGRVKDAPCEPFLGDPDAMLATLLPVDQAFDMAVNVFTYQPGATLPFVETHVMEHGLYMAAGQGVYRLGERWYPVRVGDAIWMAAYCPQWFVAMGKTPARYIYYKDVNRDPLSP
ncbi:hypothetical protein Pla175_41580 [Pirellulimonas nuda]|uniref:Cupin type-2 domain-containing protein n=1 Tax=Pirellulimonas nuda TaxID=2528009 RepID=A0A518DGZ8_9BACT|nr:(S)-ureidoglycine aminohydrolase [Pirellulimonas nuda]QDU90747.1 hypothetical protein Pla175_41580 [Pirellulimonas nuda]